MEDLNKKELELIKYIDKKAKLDAKRAKLAEINRDLLTIDKLLENNAEIAEITGTEDEIIENMTISLFHRKNKERLSTILEITDLVKEITNYELNELYKE